ncbi:MAG: HEAT repeat domain-containing protein [Planctomycetes bacterium]|nr:HEAT repeat domain-containing protein [Planctomycetota bacterium]
MKKCKQAFIVVALVGLVMCVYCQEQNKPEISVAVEPASAQISPAPVPVKPEPAYPDILGPVELSYLKSALRAIKMTPQDLLYRKNLMPDMPYRLKAVDRLMANPLEVPFYADKLARCIAGAGNNADLNLIISKSALELDLSVEESEEPGSENSSEPVITEEQTKNLPVNISKVLQRVAVDMDSAGALVKEAFAGLSEEGKKNLAEHGANFDIFQGYDSLNREKLLSGSLIICRDIGFAREQLSAWKEPVYGKPASEFGLPETAAKGGILFYAQTKIGEVIVGDSGPNEYYRDFSLIIDIGGDDIYTCRAGGTDGRTEPPAAVCIDMAGNNQFTARMKETPPKHEDSDKLEPGNDRIDLCHGAALAGIGVLAVFGNGNNTFSAGDWSQGAAFLGAGILYRSGTGNDSYQGLDCVQGASSLGIGILIDNAGDDKYKATFASQGFGAEGGFGLLLDRTGNDNYYAGGRYEDYPQRPKGSFIAMSQGFGYGLRPGCSGGIGALIDNAGDDFHLLDNQFGMGGSYWYGFGMMVDDIGNDIYHTGKDGDYDGYTLGAPIHLAAACMIDRAGNDEYNGNKIGPAVGWDMSPGWLIDGGGDDKFSSDAEWNWIAAGVQNGCGFLIKKNGNLSFEGRNCPCGQANRDDGSIGILLSLGGNGSYKNVAPKMRSNTWWSGPAGDQNSMWCIGIDEQASPDFKPDSSIAEWPSRMPGRIPDMPETSMEGIERVDSTPYKGVIDSAMNLKQQDKAGEAIKLLEDVRGNDSFDPELLYELAALYSGDDNNRALTGLAEAVKCGFSDMNRLANDTRFTAVRELPGYGEVAIQAASHSLSQEEMDKLWIECVKEQGAHWDKSEVARNKFKELGRPGIYYAIPKMISGDGYEQSWASMLVTYHGKNAVPVLMDHLRVKDKNMKRVIISLIGEIGDPRATEALLPYLGQGGLTDVACIALGQLKDKRAVPGLIKLSETDRFKESELFRKLISVALGRIADPSAVPHLIKGIGDTYFWVRYPSEEALTAIGEPAVPALIETVQQGRFPACAHALAALGRIKDNKNRAYDVIVKELKNPDWAMRGFAAEALGEYGNQDAAVLLDDLNKTEPHPFVRHKIEWASGKFAEKK